jgi:hypothetical protein
MSGRNPAEQGVEPGSSRHQPVKFWNAAVRVRPIGIDRRNQPRCACQRRWLPRRAPRNYCDIHRSSLPIRIDAPIENGHGLTGGAGVNGGEAVQITLVIRWCNPCEALEFLIGHGGHVWRFDHVRREQKVRQWLGVEGGVWGLTEAKPWAWISPRTCRKGSSGAGPKSSSNKWQPIRDCGRTGARRQLPARSR